MSYLLNTACAQTIILSEPLYQVLEARDRLNENRLNKNSAISRQTIKCYLEKNKVMRVEKVIFGNQCYYGCKVT